MRILVRGGSIAAGVGVARGYADILRDRYAPRGVELINRSNPKETSFEGIETFSRDIEPFRPDILILHFVFLYLTPSPRSIAPSSRRTSSTSSASHVPSFRPDIFLLTSHTFDNPQETDAVFIHHPTIWKDNV